MHSGEVIRAIIITTRIFIQDNLSVLTKRTVIKRVLYFNLISNKGSEGKTTSYNMCVGDVVVVDIFAFTLYVRSFLDDLNS